MDGPELNYILINIIIKIYRLKAKLDVTISESFIEFDGLF